MKEHDKGIVIQKEAFTSQIIKKKFSSARNSVKPTKRKILVLENEMKQYFDSNGYLSWSSRKKKYIILGTNTPNNGILKCPECNIGKLVVIYSPISKKRFIGCSNYYNGCKASTPLLQKAMLRVIKVQCKICSWPIVVFRYSRKQKWTKRCSNIKCNSNKTTTQN